MLKSYPTFKKGQANNVYKRLAPKEKEAINKYVDFCSATLTNKEKIGDVKRIIIQFRYVIQEDFNKFNLQKLRDFLTLLNKSERSIYNKNDIKVWIKKFLKWKFKDWSKRFQNLEDIKTQKPSNEKKINSKTILHKEEVEKIMKAESRLFWKTFFITLYESGLRPIEIRNLKWSDIKFNVDGDVSEINLFATKTRRARSVFVEQATYYLKKLQEETESRFVFPSKSDAEKPIIKTTISMWFRSIGKKALGREIFPYLLRHSRATELYKNAGIPDKIAQKFMGHSKNMADVYTHLDSDDVKNAMSKTIYHLEELPPEKKQEFEKEIKLLSQDLAVSQVYNNLFVQFFTGKITKKQLEEQIKLHQEAKGIIKKK